MTQNSDKQIDTRDGYVWTKQDCPVCEAAPSTSLGKRGGRSHREQLGVESEIWSCGRCGLVFPDPMPFPQHGLGQHYEVDADQYFVAHDKDSRRENAEKLIAKAEELLGRTGRVLDIGIGRGEVLKAAIERGWDAEGVEPSESFADYAERETGAKIWRTSIEEASTPDNHYDVVVLAAVLEHLYDPDAIMEKISRILKKGGLLFVDVPNEKGLYFKVGNFYQKLRGRDWCVNLAPTFPPFHVFGFGPKSLRMLLEKHGLSPKVWTVYAGTSLVPSRGGFAGMIESQASKLITALSGLGEMGTYIETWAEKR